MMFSAEGAQVDVPAALIAQSLAPYELASMRSKLQEHEILQSIPGDEQSLSSTLEHYRAYLTAILSDMIAAAIPRLIRGMRTHVLSFLAARVAWFISYPVCMAHISTVDCSPRTCQGG